MAEVKYTDPGIAVGNGINGHMIAIDRGPRMAGLREAMRRLEAQGE
jgi:hypothetical protein